jgi:ATP-dependent Clp protease ATP-binding subunit ClpC
MKLRKPIPMYLISFFRYLMKDSLLTVLAGRVDFKNTIIIMTSNIGTRQIKDFGQGVGFTTSSREASSNDYMKDIIHKALKKAFAPEFLNRVDDVITFNHLQKEDIHKIIDIELKGLYQRMNDLGIQG